MIHKVLYILFLFAAVLPISAQNQFVTLNWDELPSVQTLPEYIYECPLPDDYDSYNYHVDIEFPEFVNVDQKAAVELMEKKTALPEYPQTKTRVTVSAHKAFLNISFIPVVYRNGVYQRINSCKLSVSRSAKPETAIRSIAELPTTQTSVLATGRFVKIRVSDTGVYRITHAELRKMGFSSPEKVRLYGYGGYLLSRLFAEHPADDLPEVPMHRTGDAVLFYARGTVSWNASGDKFSRVRNFYSDYGYYFLTESDEKPLEFPVEASVPESGAVSTFTTFNAYALYEKDAYFWLSSGGELYDSYDYSMGNVQNYSFKLPGIVENGSAYVAAAFSAKSTENSSFKVSVGSESLGTQSISGISEGSYYVKAAESIATYPWKGSKAEASTITITHNRSASIPGRLNYIVINYQQHLRMNGSYLMFRVLSSKSVKSTFKIAGASSSTVVWDVTSPDEIKRMEGTLNGDTYTFTIPANALLREFVAVNTSASFGSVETVGEVSNQNLHALADVNMVIIVPDRPAFIQQAERLAQAHRDKDKLTVQVVKAPLIYNEFSSGTPDATAYRRFMKMLYDRSTSEDAKLKYLLLFGDASHDNRMITSAWKSYKPSDFLLSFQVDSSLNEEYSYLTDDYFGFLDNEDGVSLSSDKVDIGIGRFPVRTVGEATVAVDKTIAYMENKHAGPWKRTIVYAADDAGDKDSREFMENAIEVSGNAQKYCPIIRPERILEDAYKRESSATGYTYPEATKRLLQLFDQGMLLVTYTGHSGTTNWSGEFLLTADHINKLASPRMPIWFTASCDFTRFDDISTSAGEMAFLNPNGGAIALFSTSRVVYNDANFALHKAFTEAFFTNSGKTKLRLGDIVRIAKIAPITSSSTRPGNKLNFNLTGDPALLVTYPDYQVKIDEFNGPLSEEIPFMRAGAKMTVKGHILTPEGEAADDFTGTIHPLVYDNEETVTTLDNVGKGPVKYTDHMKVLFSGVDSVRNGRFEFTFPVPLDINYSNEQGLLNIYACSTDKREAGGMFDRFLVGGTDDGATSDGKGPNMNIYLNTPDFPWGGQVNETPYFVAQLEDEEGINTVGNGIGHDLSLCIDGKTTYTLNNYYTSVAGSYTKGTVGYSIPVLSEGKHKLTFRAWDIMNNSSVKELEFEVVKGLRPDLFSVTCSNSPARDNTTFILSHDRQGTEVSVRIAVCDFSGRELWVHTEQNVSAENYYYVDWNLCSNAGQRLSPGVYLYRASMTTEGSEESTKTEKIVILAQ